MKCIQEKSENLQLDWVWQYFMYVPLAIHYIHMISYMLEKCS